MIYNLNEKILIEKKSKNDVKKFFLLKNLIFYKKFNFY